MTSTFVKPGASVVMAIVKRIAGEGLFFFAKNGEPGQIMCHSRQGGIGLSISRKGNLYQKTSGRVYPPSLNEEVAIIRETEDPHAEGYTKAFRWVPAKAWNDAKHLIRNATTVYRLTGFNHRTNGQFTAATRKSVTVDQGTLAELMVRHPNGMENIDSEGIHTSTLANIKFTYETRWERLCDDGKWVECGNPFPTHCTMDI